MLHTRPAEGHTPVCLEVAGHVPVAPRALITLDHQQRDRAQDVGTQRNVEQQEHTAGREGIGGARVGQETAGCRWGNSR